MTVFCFWGVCMCLAAQSCLTLCDPMDYSLMKFSEDVSQKEDEICRTEKHIFA